MIIVAMLGCSGCSGGSAPAIAHVRIEPSVIDLGLIGTQSGHMGKGEFRIMNRGSEILKILGMKSSCGCTVPQLPSMEIGPGDEEVVKVHIDPRNESGSHSSEIVIQTNDPAHPLVTVLVKWIEQSAITFVPNHLDFGWVKSDETIEVDVTLQLADQIDPRGLHIESNYPGLKIVQDRDVVIRASNERSGTLKRVCLELKVGSENGHQATELQVVSSDKQYTARLPISWRTGPPVDVTPKAIFRSDIGPGSFFECRLLVRAADESSIVVRNIEYDGQSLEYEAESLGQSANADWIVTFSLQADPTAGIKEHLVRLAIGDGPDGIIDVPVTLVIR
ncbi:DUF1573 domain-containing protein [Tautonia sociabilis]|uniref:DUF1573 domain-containing protein n=1 Tax=Tautonia sociabilis TaxID=2080755 RepID=UPI001F21CCD0|nr:DUF1573 domain-containing protein [Tautonia sociabilis]